jgi:GNAT superfamily N-acetyltransferase
VPCADRHDTVHRSAWSAVTAGHIEGRVVGFIALAEQTRESVEVHVLAVDRAHHRSGAGRALIGWAQAWGTARGVRWLHVKTRGPATPDPDYARTRAFYHGVGFETLFETQDLWGPQDAALILVKRLAPDAGRG